MIDTLGLAIREGFGLVIASVLPLLAVAAVAAILLGLLCGALGIRDAALGQIVRALAVVLALAMIIQGVATSTLAFATRCWTQLGEPQEAPPPEPQALGTEP